MKIILKVGISTNLITYTNNKKIKLYHGTSDDL
jgi:hypothetical protein